MSLQGTLCLAVCALLVGQVPNNDTLVPKAKGLYMNRVPFPYLHKPYRLSKCLGLIGTKSCWQPTVASPRCRQDGVRVGVQWGSDGGHPARVTLQSSSQGQALGHACCFPTKQVRSRSARSSEHGKGPAACTQLHW